MKVRYALMLLILPLLVLTGCSKADYAETGTLIVESDEVQKLLDAGYKLVDAQKASSYAKGHVEGAVNIERKQITVQEPVPNMVGPASQIAAVAGAAGLTESDNILIYDGNRNMDSGRLYWTLKFYGHKGDIRLISGGLKALKAEEFKVSKSSPSVSAASYTAGSADGSMVIDTAELAALIEKDDPDTVIIDVRSDDEYYAGTVPGSCHINFENNNFTDDSFKTVQQIKILYKENGIMPDDTVIMYCKTSIRAANTYAALYNAGYRNLRIYDAAWLGWEASGERIYTPEKPGAVSVSVQDNS